MQIYEDGGAKCYSCGTYFRDVGNQSSAVHVPRFNSNPDRVRKETIEKSPVRGFPTRDITRKVCEFYGVRSIEIGGDITHHFYPYQDSWKVREVGPKNFYWVPSRANTLFGQERFSGGGRRVVLVEGEMDVLAMQQANLDGSQKFFPVVGLPSSSDLGALMEQREWLRSFREVVVFMDNDSAGQKALERVLKTIGYDKCRVMEIPENDINDQLLKPDGAKILVSSMFNARERVPAGVVGRDTIRKAIIERLDTPSHPYNPALADVNKKLIGKRGGEIVLFISGTGCGKSTMFREEILHTLHTTDAKIGVVSLEEAVGETGQKLAAMNMNVNPAAEHIDQEDLLRSFDEVFGSDGDERLMLLDHQGAITDNTIMDQLTYMCLKGCKYLFIDHITILVSEGVDGLTGNEAQDRVMNDLLRLVKRFPDVWVGLISHLRKSTSERKSFEEGRMPSIDDIKGSGAIKQISFDIIAFARNTTAEEEDERNTINLSVLKCRWNGDTGPAGSIAYNRDTGRIRAVDGFSTTPSTTFTKEEASADF